MIIIFYLYAFLCLLGAGFGRSIILIPICTKYLLGVKCGRAVAQICLVLVFIVILLKAYLLYRCNNTSPSEEADGVFCPNSFGLIVLDASPAGVFIVASVLVLSAFLRRSRAT